MTLAASTSQYRSTCLDSKEGSSVKKASKRRFVLELAATAIASPLLLGLLLLTHAYRIAWFIAFPVIWFGRTIAGWISLKLPGQDDGWFGGLTTIAIVDAVLLWVYTWALLICALKLFERLTSGKEKA
jgi:hypothetical protein